MRRDSAPDEVLKLVERFDRHAEMYHSRDYREADIRTEFLDHFFEALGWDVFNKKGFDLSHRQVERESRQRVEGKSRAPDYAFRIGGHPEFFVEAKKPAVNLSQDPGPALQLRRYAWNADMLISILTDFEEFRVYSAQIKPRESDKPDTACLKSLLYKEYADNWPWLVDNLSPEAVQRGSLKILAGTEGKRKGTARVDDEFLKDIETWRILLAKNIALRNPRLGTPDNASELNLAVQATIDRIVFLRICEDRGIEASEPLRALLNSDGIYKQLFARFQAADERYNSGLFYFKPEKNRKEHLDEIAPRLKIDDAPLKELISGLYPPKSPYEFSVMPADVLGQVYERFLGSVIRLTTGHQAKVEEKPEVRKAGGVYYTPTYIVDYIVKNTVGKLLEGSTPKQALKLRILDPACGSGSFLIGAYQYLLDWFRDQYFRDGPNKHRDELYQAGDDDWRLTARTRKEILRNCIYGVDIDRQAVEVTKLSLLLKVLEGETAETVNSQLSMFHDRALPDLGSNIKCGNSLIGHDFFSGDLFEDQGLLARINPFDWQDEFPAIMKAGGFDSVVGNPPYIRMEEFTDIKSYLRTRYVTHSDRADIFYYFIERSISLLKNGGLLGYIVSNTFTRSRAGSGLRSFLHGSTALQVLVEFGDFTPFEGATVYPLIMVTEKTKPKSNVVPFVMQAADPTHAHPKQQWPVLFTLQQSSLGESEWVFEERHTKELRSRLLAEFRSLRDVYGEVGMGIKTGLNEAFVISGEERRRILARNKKAEAIIRPYVAGEAIDRWQINWNDEWLIYTPHGIDMAPYPSVLAYLAKHRPALESRATEQKWYELQQPQELYSAFFGKPKIVYPDMSRYPKFNLDTKGMYFSNTVYFIAGDSPYLVGLLNSKLLWFVIRGLSNALRGGLWRFRLFSGHVERLPIRELDLSNKTDKARHDKMVGLVEKMLDLHKRLQKTKSQSDKEALNRQIVATDRQIDELVYELYGLTDKEIKIVEGSGG